MVLGIIDKDCMPYISTLLSNLFEDEYSIKENDKGDIVVHSTEE